MKKTVVKAKVTKPSKCECRVSLIFMSIISIFSLLGGQALYEVYITPNVGDCYSNENYLSKVDYVEDGTVDYHFISARSYGVDSGTRARATKSYNSVYSKDNSCIAYDYQKWLVEFNNNKRQEPLK